MRTKAAWQYLRVEWRAFTSSAAFGIAAGLTIVPWVLGKAQAFIASRDPLIPVAILIAISASLVLAWPSAVKFWRRYRRTHSLEHPPLQDADVIAIFLTSVATTLFLYHQRIVTQIGTAAPTQVFFAGLPSLILIWFFSTWLWSWRKEVPKAKTTLLRQSPGDYSDEPIHDGAEDLLGRVVFVDGLYRQIANLLWSDSYVFGLHAGWGEGKTSVLNLLHRRLVGTPLVIPVSFNPWYFSTDAAIIQGFYNSIEQALQGQYILSRGFRRIFHRYQNVLTLGLRSIGFKFELPVRDDPGDLRSDLESWIERTGCRLVISIDDIDRLQPSEILAVFKLTALAARLRNIVFVLSFDTVVVTSLLRDDSRVDPAFLEKVIQKPVPMPPAEQRDIDRFLLFSEEGTEAHRSAIDRLLDETGVDPIRRQQFDREIVSFYQRYLRRLFRTIRQAKRYLNGLRATLPPVIDEVHLYDFFLLEIIRVFFPNVYRDIWNNPWFYIPPWTFDTFLISPFGPPSNPEEKYQRINQHIEGLLANEPQREVVEAILEEIFFVEVKNAFARAGRMGHDNVAAMYRAEKRLTHPECFPKYFFFRVPSGELADQVVEELILNPA